MFLAYFGIAFAAKRTAPSVSLGTLFLASHFMVLLLPLLLLLGIDRAETGGNLRLYYPDPLWLGLLTAMVLAAAFGLVYYGIRRSARGAWITAALVVIYWTIGLIRQRPDLPVIRGLNLPAWSGRPAFLQACCLTEAILFVLGVIVYARSTKAINLFGRIGFWSLVFIPLAFNIQTTIRKTGADAGVAVAALAQLIGIAWAYIIDAHRRPVMR